MDCIQFRRPGCKSTCRNVATAKWDRSCRRSLCGTAKRIRPTKKSMKQCPETSAVAELISGFARRLKQRRRKWHEHDRERQPAQIFDGRRCRGGCACAWCALLPQAFVRRHVSPQYKRGSCEIKSERLSRN